MREYELTYETIEQGRKGTLYLFATDRNDAREMFYRVYKNGKLKGCRAVTKAKPKKQTEKVFAEALTLIEMTEKAKLHLMVNAHNGQSIGKYLGLIMASDPTREELARAVNWVVRQVENKNETFVQKKF